MREFLRGAFVIARRDFAATVFSRSFLFFLLAPLFPVVVGLIFGGLTVSASRQVDRAAVAVVAGERDFAALAAVRKRLQDALPDAMLVRLVRVPPGPEIDSSDLLANPSKPPLMAVLEGGLDHPRLVGSVGPDSAIASQLALILGEARELRAARPTQPGLPLVVVRTEPSAGSLVAQRAITAQSAQIILFILTVLLSTMLLSQLIEEKSNKIIEVLAAAVSVSAIFLGKLVAMLAVSLLGITVWVSAAAAAFSMFAESGLEALPSPALGWPAFLALALVYFAMSYLLVGAIFLGIGGHASSAREVQTLSMPVTMAQIVVFAIAALAVGEPNSTIALSAAAFPLSSPYVLLARAAELPQLWPHFLAIAWQLLWVGVILTVAARMFRRSVLKSGRQRRRLFARGAA